MEEIMKKIYFFMAIFLSSYSTYIFADPTQRTVPGNINGSNILNGINDANPNGTVITTPAILNRHIRHMTGPLSSPGNVTIPPTVGSPLPYSPVPPNEEQFLPYYPVPPHEERL